jgi:anti-sigma regulatory factor (Ser/Thr protein kinase)
VVGEVSRSDTDSERSGAASVDLALAAVPRSISTARHAVARLLQTTPPVPDEVVEDVLLLVSEVVTNAVLHARTEVHVEASVVPGRILVSVADDDPLHAPHRPERGALATSGRGMHLVERLATTWGVEVFATSKVVWFETTFRLETIDLRARFA